MSQIPVERTTFIKMKEWKKLAKSISKGHKVSWDDVVNAMCKSIHSDSFKYQIREILVDKIAESKKEGR